ncbi:unnamed protein product [Laminaria digitata]
MEIGKVFLVAGLIVATLLFAVFPCAIKALGMTTWQRTGCLVGIPAFIAIPNARLLSWNDSGLFAVSAACIALIYCCQAMVMLAFVFGSTSLVQSSMRGKLAGLYNAVESFGSFSVQSALPTGSRGRFPQPHPTGRTTASCFTRPRLVWLWSRF